MKFNWVTLHIRDTARSRAFYGELLGMTLAREFTQPGGRQFTFFRSEDGMQVELIEDADGAVECRGLSLGVAVENYDDVLEKARALGIVTSGPTVLGGHLECFFASDPDGVNVQIARA